jgi:hypothetical protein
MPVTLATFQQQQTATGWDSNPLDLVGAWSLGDDMDLLPDVGGTGGIGVSSTA